MNEAQINQIVDQVVHVRLHLAGAFRVEPTTPEEPPHVSPRSV